jgi:hypothetical protein
MDRLAERLARIALLVDLDTRLVMSLPADIREVDLGWRTLLTNKSAGKHCSTGNQVLVNGYKVVLCPKQGNLLPCRGLPAILESGFLVAVVCTAHSHTTSLLYTKVTQTTGYDVRLISLTIINRHFHELYEHLIVIFCSSTVWQQCTALNAKQSPLCLE